MVAVAMPVMMLVLNLGIVGALWFGGVQVTGGTMQVGQIIAFVNYLMRTLMSLMMVEHVGHAHRPRPGLGGTHPGGAGQRAQGPEQARCRRPTFARRDGWPLKTSPLATTATVTTRCSRDISFVAEPGQTVAILGATGSGKSSLVHLIPRFYDVTRGG